MGGEEIASYYWLFRPCCTLLQMSKIYHRNDLGSTYHSVFFFDFCFTYKYQKYILLRLGFKSVISVFCTFLSINQKLFVLEKHAIPLQKALFMSFLSFSLANVCNTNTFWLIDKNVKKIKWFFACFFLLFLIHGQISRKSIDQLG